MQGAYHYKTIQNKIEHNTIQNSTNIKPIIIIICSTVSTVINLRGVSTNRTIICFIAMQTYKELIKPIILLSSMTWTVTH